MKTRNTTRLRLSLAVALSVFGSGVTQPVNAQLPPILPDQPLFLNLFVPPPNIAFGLDNSGSMEWRHVRKNLMEIAPYLTEAGDRFVEAIPFSDFAAQNNNFFVFDRGDNYVALLNKIYLSCTGANIFAYNPKILYAPWPGFPNKTMTTAQFSDPGYETTTVDVSGNMIVDWNDNGDDIFNLPTEVWDPSRTFNDGAPDEIINPNDPTSMESFDRRRDATTGEPDPIGGISNGLIEVDRSADEGVERYDKISCNYRMRLSSNILQRPIYDF